MVDTGNVSSVKGSSPPSRCLPDAPRIPERRRGAIFVTSGRWYRGT